MSNPHTDDELEEIIWHAVLRLLGNNFKEVVIFILPGVKQMKVEVHSNP
jgi:hypothetical protein